MDKQENPTPLRPPGTVLEAFLPGRFPVRLTPLGQGNINDTWLVDLADGDRRVLQRLHPTVFPDPLPVMRNLRLVTDHLATVEQPGAPACPSLIATAAGQDQHLDASGCWRMLTFIDRSRTLASPVTARQARETGRLLGRFHRLTAGLALNLLADPLPGFHVTPRYLARFDALAPHPPARNVLEQHCFAAVTADRHLAPILEEAREALRQQVIHGDPKLTNVLFAEDEDQALCLIDLDTVKPGLLLHDIGDCLRSCCNHQGEEASDPGAAAFASDLFQALLAGYWPEAGHLLGQADRDLLVTAARLICFELGLRFFTDHLEGDRYFKVRRPGQNLHRAAVQFHLAESVRAQEDDLQNRLDRLIRDQSACISEPVGL